MKKITLLLFSILFLLCQKKSRVSEDEIWLGFYIEGKKVGYSYQKFQTAQEQFRFYNRTKMRMRMGEEVQELLATTDCVTAKDFSIRELKFELISQKQKVKLHGLVKGDDLHLAVLTVPLGGSEASESPMSALS